MGYAGNAYAFKDKKELKAFKKKHLELKDEDRIGYLGSDFSNLMLDYFGYSTSGIYTLTYEQVEELIGMADGILKGMLKDLLQALDASQCRILYVEGYN
ncbi:hypothetical protein F7P74_06175 [Helicobacter pullorum NCTC 12824]|uniref:hypothetical protein n=1 Tax=Helicobacter pullorum TaxID=35818 RepID=UPI001245F13D|nr:hypothetical protein [Helicobacter pullorum]KAB0574517.1 hypothetical protein F7P74_06175 [Helicobacter pullorum NCTC 12824]